MIPARLIVISANLHRDFRPHNGTPCGKQTAFNDALDALRFDTLYGHVTDLSVRSLRWAYVLVGVADGTLLPFIPLYLAQHGLSPGGVGAVLAAAALAALCAGLGWAYLADRKLKAERLVVGATGAASLVALFLPAAAGAVGMTAVIVLLTIVRSPLGLLDPITLRRLRLTSRTDYARIRLRMSAGFTASAMASGVAYEVGGLRLIPFIYVPLTVLAGAWIWRSVKPEPHAADEDASRPAVRVPAVPLAMVGFLVACLLLGISLAATQNFLVLQIDYLGGGALLVGAASAFQAVTEVPTMGFTHVLMKRISNRVLFAIGCAIYLIVFIAWAFVSSALVAALLKLVIGVAFALVFVAAVMIANELTPSRLRATGQALVKSVLFGVAPIAGALGGGLVYGSLGARFMFLAATLVVAGAGVIAVIAVPARRRAPVEQPVLAANAGRA
jgi:PPP family 3-phenylpropionic acid transporter